MPNRSATAFDLDLTDVCRETGDAKVCLFYELKRDGKIVSDDTFWFTHYKNVELPTGRVDTRVDGIGPGKFSVQFESSAIKVRFQFDLPGLDYRASDNSFDLAPNQPRVVEVIVDPRVTAAEIRRKLTAASLKETY